MTVMVAALTAGSLRAGRRSDRGHAQGAVHAHDLAVEVVVVDERERQLGVLLRSTESLREGDSLRQALAELLRDRREHRGLDDAGGDREHADAVLGEVTSGGQGEPDDAGLAGGVGRLPDLALVAGDGG